MIPIEEHLQVLYQLELANATVHELTEKIHRLNYDIVNLKLKLKRLETKKGYREKPEPILFTTPEDEQDYVVTEILKLFRATYKLFSCKYCRYDLKQLRLAGLIPHYLLWEHAKKSNAFDRKEGPELLEATMPRLDFRVRAAYPQECEAVGVMDWSVHRYWKILSATYWGCLKTDGSVEVHLWTGDRKDFQKNGFDNDLVDKVVKPFEANSREEAEDKVRRQVFDIRG